MAQSYDQLVLEARAATRGVSNDEARDRVAAGALLLDVREANEWAAGHLPGAEFVPRGELESRIEAMAPDRGRPVVERVLVAVV